MFSKLSLLARTSVIALAALGSLPADAAPLGLIGQPAVADKSVGPTPVAQGEGRDCGPGYSCNPRNPRVRNRENRDEGELNDRDRRRREAARDDDDNGRNDDRRRRRNYRDRYDDDFEFGLGLGVSPDDGYYDDPSYDEPIYRPRHRRVYRDDGSGHVEWCYGRYRSYREWDNTWQPSYGRRRQCISPYS
jgi:hypothetical protein